MSFMDDQKLYDDHKYRNYATQIEKALKNFEYSTEWADLISALVKLNKVLLSNTSYATLPKRITIGKRLGQCLHPALPGGVHIKALEVYDTIFKIIGKKRLELDLHIFSTGLFSLLANASMQVRPVLLNVYETHLLPLGERLRTSLDGMLLGLLPGLEEGSEHFDRITLLLDKISKSVGRQHFYSSLWRCVLCSPSGSTVRLAASQLILRQFDKKKMTDDQLHLIGLDVDVMIYALCENLQDENVLTQRATLDILIFCFPLSSLPVSRSDAQQVMSSAINILLRRDMSLNRRLYSWLLGTDLGKSRASTSSESNQYFEKHSQEMLTSAISDAISSNVNAFDSICCVASRKLSSGVEVKLLRIITSLLDKSDIGPVILNDIMSGIMRLIEIVDKKFKFLLSPDVDCKNCIRNPVMYDVCTRAQSEFAKLVNLFVNTFEADYIWNFMGDFFVQSCLKSTDYDHSKPETETDSDFTIVEMCNVIQSMLDIISIETLVEIQTLHLPKLLDRSFLQLAASCDVITEDDIAACLNISMVILKHIQPVQADYQNENATTKSPILSCVISFQNFLATFITTKIIKDKESMECFLKRLERTHEYMTTGTISQATARNSPVIDAASMITFKSYGDLDAVVLKTFQDSCQLLIDISCFPMLAFSSVVHLGKNDQTETGLPEWLLRLMACSCYKEHKSSPPESARDLNFFYEIRKAACSTILELLAATRKSSMKTVDNEERKVISVVVPPPFTEYQIKLIFESTNYVQHAGEILWEELRDTATDSRLSLQSWSLSRLLISLHELCPTNTVEELLLHDILSPDQTTRVIAIKKFGKLWHYMKEGSKNRDKDKNLSGSLFAVLDQLVIDRYVLFPHQMTSRVIDYGQSLASSTVSIWLRQALEEGDLSCILEPYFLLTLEQNTNRKSLQKFLEEKDEEMSNVDQIDYFIHKHAENMLSTTCQSCVNAKSKIEKGSFSWMNYQGVSFDSMISHDLCEVHHQIAQEKHSYEHLVGLLTLSDDLEVPTEFRSVANSAEEDLNTWVVGFVNMVIAQGLHEYQTELDEEIARQIGTDVDIEQEDQLSENSSVSQATEAIELNQSFMMNENPLYNHVLIYQEMFDTKRVMYGLQGILNIASAHPSVFIYSACTTSLSSSESSYSNLVQDLLVRHERSIEQGKSFYELTPLSLRGAMKNRMLIEVLISICLYYLRSAFQHDIKAQEVDMNHEIHTIAAKLLKFIIRELRNLTQEDTIPTKGLKKSSSIKQFSAYVVLVLQRQQVQSVAMTCLLTTIFALKNHGRSMEDSQSISNYSGVDVNLNFDEEALHFSRSDHLVDRYLGSDVLHVTTMFSHFLELVFELVTLESSAFSSDRKVQGQDGEESQSGGSSGIVMNKKRGSLIKPTLKRSHRLFSHLLAASHQYDSDSSLASQKVFVSTILEIYRLDHQPSLHQECSIGLHSVLSYLGPALSATVLPVLLQQCLNLENVTKLMLQGSHLPVPPRYLESTISSLVKLCHYCLLSDTGSTAEKQSTDNSQVDSISLMSSKTTQSAGNSSLGAGWFNLLNVFNMSSSNKTTLISNDAERSDGIVAAKVAILSNLARIVSCMCVLWKDIVMGNKEQIICNEEVKGVSYTILQLLGPMAIRYGEYLLVAFSLVWQDREIERSSSDFTKSISLMSLSKPNPSLDHIIDLMMAMKLLSTEMFFALVRQVIVSPPPTTNEHKDVSLHESLLQMLLFYMRRLKPAVLLENWSGFLAILQESLSLGPFQNNQTFFTPDNPVTPNCYFLLMYLLSEYVKRSIVFTGKKEQKELQDVVTKCVEACNIIAGSSLEQGTWIRRTVSVLPGPQAPENPIKSHKKTESQSSLDLTDVNTESQMEPQMHSSSSDTMVAVLGQKSAEGNGVDEARPETARPLTLQRQVSKPSLNSVNFRNSVKALTVLSEVVANLLDVVYSSEDKEKIVPILSSIMANVTPYLRNHNKDNTPSYSACVAFLSSISGFQYTRRAWRKEIIDLFMDGLYFHMPQECFGDWKNIIDNLMTHDKLTFKDIMSRTTLSKTGGSTPTLSLFSNKEQELELRALHIKRLAFIVFSSEVDQYQRQLPEIQERLAESLRLNNIPGVQCRVFLCLRVLLLRISPHSLTSLWPTIFTELVHAMMQLEQALQPAISTEIKRSRLRAKLGKASSHTSVDRKTVMTCWDDMYLSACKLLDLILCLPSQCVPQFQLYKWSFIGDVAASTPHNGLTKNNFHPRMHIRPSTAGTPVDAEPEPIEDTFFVPHCVRIQRLFSELYPARKERMQTIIPEKPLLNITRLKSLEQLQPFFNTIASPVYLLKMQSRLTSSKPAQKPNFTAGPQRTLPLVEKTLERDFVRYML